ncbi:hypothetical protein TL16_g05489 [Triparma laevis f. inornata]|uniref:Uncharacterized protein n=1 Tax=Triparma laevis f. inornata TaxID=1714386 RepID=A0A9W7AM03_9STRA|nr:hypothetical protein TL16_g05489 [Triparma laevis f. inornata]
MARHLSENFFIRIINFLISFEIMFAGLFQGSRTTHAARNEAATGRSARYIHVKRTLILFFLCFRGAGANMALSGKQPRSLVEAPEPSHDWNFQDCATGETVADSIAGQLVATPENGPACGQGGISLDGSDDFVELDNWEWGGTTSFEVYAKYDSFNTGSRVFAFGSGSSSDNVFLKNDGTTSTISWNIRQGSTKKDLDASNFDSLTWTHIIATVSGTKMKVYKNGVLVGTKTDGWEPRVLTRSQHWLGRSAWSSDGYFYGTIAYVKVWNGVELQQSDVTDLYAPHNTAHHFWDFRGCITSFAVTDSIAGDLVATPKSGPTCSTDGLSLDGSNDYVDISDWEWGGTMSFEVYVKYNSFNLRSRVFDFGSGEYIDNVALYNDDTKSNIRWAVDKGSGSGTYRSVTTSNWDSLTWVHVIVTVSGTNMKVYKNGVEVGTNTAGHEPNVITRTSHIIGASNWGVWHGVELQQTNVTNLYSPHNTAHHFWDFRGCTTGGPTCSVDGIRFDGSNDYADIDDWTWGGTTSFEVYVKYDSFNKWSSVFDFGSGAPSDNVLLANKGTTSTIQWNIYRGSSQKYLRRSNWVSSTWTHIVLTVKGRILKMYKNGAFVGSYTNGFEPEALIQSQNDDDDAKAPVRSQHWLGRSALSSDGYFDGTIAYVKVWHGVELQQSDVTHLYAPHNSAHHFWDFRGCTTGSPVTDSVAGDLDARPTSGPTCSADGISLDGSNDHVNLDDWEWGGTTSFEVYVKYDSFDSWSRIFDFGNGEYNENVLLANFGALSTISWEVFRGSPGKNLRTSNLDSSTWTHVVVTVSGNTMKIFKNGVLVGTKTDGHEPNVDKRTNHWLGRSNWWNGGYFDGTIAYVKVWHGVELQQTNVTNLYSPYNSAHHFWDFRHCIPGSAVADSIAGDLNAMLKNNPSCSDKGVSLDGSNAYVDIDDWTWGGPTSFEVYVMFDGFSHTSRVLDFGSGTRSDNVYLANSGASPAINWRVNRGSSGKGFAAESNFATSAWTHVVVTTKGNMMKAYKDGVLVGTETDGLEPNVLKRTNHIIGAVENENMDRFMEGTIAYVKVWHGVEVSSY